MKKAISIIGISALCMVSGAETISFTAGEGYATPAQLTTYPSWSGSAGFMINTNGAGTVDWTGNYIQMNYETGIEATAPTIETSVQFRMTRAAGYVSGGKPIIGIQLEKDAVGTGLVADGLNDVRTYMQRTSSDTFNVVFNNASQGTSDNTSWPAINESLLGLSGITGDVSDLLELKLVLHRGATTNDWTADVILRNVTTDTALMTKLARPFTSDLDYLNATLYGAFNSGLPDGTLGVDNRQIESFSISNRNAVQIDFSAGDNYTAATQLKNYAAWNGSPGFLLNPNGNGTVDWTGNYIQMNYVDGITSDYQTVETSVQFRMTQAAGYTSGAKPVIGLQLEKDNVGDLLINDGLNDVRTYMQRTSSSTFNVVFNNGTQGNDPTSWVGFDESLLGLNGTVGDVSNLLELKLVLHRGATSADWTADVILRNVTTDTAVMTQLGRAFESDEAYFTTTLYGAFNSGLQDGEIGVDSRQIESFALSGDEFLVQVVAPGYDGWAGGWGVELGEPTEDSDGDGLSNLYEYGLNGNPVNALSQGVSPTFDIVDLGAGSNVLSYVHPQLAADQLSGLTYSLALKTDLILGSWVTNSGYTVTGTNVTGGTLDFVTNITSTVEDTKFIQLIIE